MMNKPDDLTGLVDAIDDVSELVYVADPETHDPVSYTHLIH